MGLLMKYAAFFVLLATSFLSCGLVQADPCLESESVDRKACIDQHNGVSEQFDQWVFRHEYYDDSGYYSPSITVDNGDFGLRFKCSSGSALMEFTSVEPFTDSRFGLKYDDEAPFDSSAILRQKGLTLSATLDEWTIDKLGYAQTLTFIPQVNGQWLRASFNIKDALIRIYNMGCL